MTLFALTMTLPFPAATPVAVQFKPEPERVTNPACDVETSSVAFPILLGTIWKDTADTPLMHRLGGLKLTEPAGGGGGHCKTFTVTVPVCPCGPVAVIVTVPAVSAVTVVCVPEDGLTEAIAELLDDQFTDMLAMITAIVGPADGQEFGKSEIGPVGVKVIPGLVGPFTVCRVQARMLETVLCSKQMVA